MKEFIEGAYAIARTVRLCRPGVISAYPITPQTHIVEGLADIVANGELDCEFVNVESEHSAASAVLGATATGVRSYTSTSSQGLLLMTEVLFNLAGMRLPLVMCCVNRAISAPINIWNDHQDSMTVRDSGFIQLFAETIQEACDMHIIGYRLSEDKNVLLPVMVCIDGYILSHGMEPVELARQEEVDKYLPPYDLPYKIDPDKPLTLGVLSGPDHYFETRYALHETMNNETMKALEEYAKDFEKTFNRRIEPFVEKYKFDDADKVIVAMGSICGTIKDAIDELRSQGEKVGLLRIVTYRPFPAKHLFDALKDKKEIAVVDKSISLGGYSPLYLDLASAMGYHAQGAHGAQCPKISGFIIGLGGRDTTINDIKTIYKKLSGKPVETEFIGLKESNIVSVDSLIK